MKGSGTLSVIVGLLTILLVAAAFILLKWVSSASSFGQGLLRLLLSLIGLGLGGCLFFAVLVGWIFAR
ncbi:hypothetical protein LJY25_16220 [Hymenobacter sp. BT175]|uniref:hypothetical protein n=1 Tax=Hymenobacter translucens TaxID=2886507 RepID=UPI001D0F0333|nr:hypothetical protein [Hymenobacter translucens]MCC2547995.1 hypothetical protein [Hymenobacter translucens]